MTKSLKSFLLSGIILLCGVIASPLYGQSRTVNGVVQDDNGEPLYGAFVVEKGTTNGVSTDIDGKFSITLTAVNPVLEFQFIGFKTQEIQVGDGQRLLLVQMESDANLMDEVVVTAFATQKKINVTGAISAVNGNDLLALGYKGAEIKETLSSLQTRVLSGELQNKREYLIDYLEKL